ncbi:hypothetical protein, partial [Microbacterium laevaniformans]|uniref:hypothetical protein n=1 Tax=Microbacterium laevaniformans TaxID=36807 RepID=UPI0036394C3E
AVNDGKVFFDGGSQSDIWGTWSGNHPATRWLQYDWRTPQRIAGAEIGFWSDQTDPASANVSISRRAGRRSTGPARRGRTSPAHPSTR